MSDTDTFDMAGGFQFQGTPVDMLGATEYTITSTLVDVSSSLDGFEDELRKMAMMVVESCQKSPRVGNLMHRLATFASRDVKELYGFKPLSAIDLAKYPKFVTGGSTPLRDACYSGVGATNGYAKVLYDQDFMANAITFVITDGEENSSTFSETMVKDEIRKAMLAESLESHQLVVIGIGTRTTSTDPYAIRRADELKAKLTAFCEAIDPRFEPILGSDAPDEVQRKIDARTVKFVEAEDASKGTLAKLAEFVSNSISSTSQLLGTGGTSQISATI